MGLLKGGSWLIRHRLGSGFGGGGCNGSLDTVYCLGFSRTAGIVFLIFQKLKRVYQYSCLGFRVYRVEGLGCH